MLKISKYNLWSKEEVEKLKPLVGKMSFKKMVKYFPDRTEISLLKKSVKLGLSSDYKHFLNEINKDYWKEIDLLKCYYAGYIGADGCLCKERYAVRFLIHPKDIHILENFKKEVGFTGPIKISEYKYKNNKIQKRCSMYLGRTKEWYPDLKKHFNLEPIKTLRIPPPNLNNKYLEYAYIIGLIDGDGWVIHSPVRKSITIGFVSSSYLMIEWVRNKFKEIINDDLPIINKAKDKNYFYFTSSGKKAAIIIDYLRQFPLPKFDRKWGNPLILDYINKLKEKKPDLFKTLNLSDLQDLLPINQNNISHFPIPTVNNGDK